MASGGNVSADHDEGPAKSYDVVPLQVFPRAVGRRAHLRRVLHATSSRCNPSCALATVFTLRPELGAPSLQGLEDPVPHIPADVAVPLLGSDMDGAADLETVDRPARHARRLCELKHG